MATDQPLWRSELSPRLAVELGTDHNVFIVAGPAGQPQARTIVTNIDALVAALNGARLWRDMLESA